MIQGKNVGKKNIKSFQLFNFFCIDNLHILGYVNTRQLDISMLHLIAFQYLPLTEILNPRSKYSYL